MTEDDVLHAVTLHVERSADRLLRKRYHSETAYINAFLGKLDGIIDFGDDGQIEIQSTIVNDRGPGAAEKEFGADFGLVFHRQGGKSDISKAILGQAKNGDVRTLRASEQIRLVQQCETMADHTDHYIVLEAPQSGTPTVRIGSSDTPGQFSDQMPFAQYLVSQVIACHHGDRDSDFIDAVGSSDLTMLKVRVDGLKYEPDAPGERPSSRSRPRP